MSEIKKYRLREVVEAWQFNINDYITEGIPKIFESDNIVGKLEYNVLYLHRKSTNDYLTSLHVGDYVIFKNGKFCYRAAKEDWEEQFEEVVSVQIHNGGKSLEDYVSKDEIDNVVGESREGDKLKYKISKTTAEYKFDEFNSYEIELSHYNVTLTNVNNPFDYFIQRVEASAFTNEEFEVGRIIELEANDE